MKLLTCSVVLALGIFLLAGIGLFVVDVCWSVGMSRNCLGHLKRAADANSLGLAKAELQTAVDYLDRHGMTSGYTSVIYNTPDEDVGFWYVNLETSLDQINGLPPATTQAESDMVLLKLRQTLLDHGEGSEHVTHPDGIHKYPYNSAFFWFFVAWVVVLVSSGLLVLLAVIIGVTE